MNSAQKIQFFAASQLAGVYDNQREYADLWINARNKQSNMEYARAHSIAILIKDLLSPWCDRIEIAGSIRRKKAEVKDIEIVCIPKRILREKDLFDTEMVVLQQFIDQVNKWEKVKGEPDGKYTQRIIKTGDTGSTLTKIPGEGIKLDPFMATPENWGYILSIRTGSDHFSKFLADTWVSKGYRGADGMLMKGNHPVNVLEEEDLFRLVGLPFVSPELRKQKHEYRFQIINETTRSVFYSDSEYCYREFTNPGDTFTINDRGQQKAEPFQYKVIFDVAAGGGATA